MSIYIKGMEMLQLFDRLFVGKDLDGKIYIRNEREDRDRESPKWYPAIEIPPHGRLIDADKFERIKYEIPIKPANYSRGFDEGVKFVQKLIMDAPTIIPADKED